MTEWIGLKPDSLCVITRFHEEADRFVQFGLLASSLSDFTYGLRVLRKHSGFAALPILTLALGIGAASAVFSLVNAVLLRALPYGHPERLVFLWEPNPHIPGVPLDAWGPFNGYFYDWQKQSQSFARMALFSNDRMNLSVNGTAIRVAGSRVTGDFLSLLGVPTALGMTISLLNYAQKDPDENVRHWATEGMRFLGTDEALDDLFEIFVNDPSFTVRDRAGCNVSDGRNFTRKQRMRMFPKFLELVENPTANSQMRSWSFMAMHEITDVNLPSDANTWRRWYEDHGAEKMREFESIPEWQVRGDE